MAENDIDIKVGEPQFLSSFLIKQDSEMQNLDNLGMFGKRVRLLHNAARAEILPTDDWRTEYISLTNRAEETIREAEARGEDIDSTEFDQYLSRIANYIQEKDEQGGTQVAGGQQIQQAPQPGQQARTAHETTVEDTLGGIKSLIEAQAQAPPQSQLDYDVFAQKVSKALAEAMGKLTPKRQLELVREAEGAMLPVEISLTSPPDFFAHITPAEQEAWMARSTLVIAAAKKKAAIKLEMLHPNDEGMGFTKEELKTLWEHKTGSFHATALYTHMIANNLNVSDVLGDVGPDLGLNKIFEIEDDPSFEGLRKKMRAWIGTKLGLNEIDARDAEQIAWNIVYTTSLLEDKDTKFNSAIGLGKKRNPGNVSSLKNVATWVLMHPQERLEAKSEKRESWGAFGEWSLMMANSGRRLPEILPRSLVHNGLLDTKIEVKPLQPGDSTKTNLEAYLTRRAQHLVTLANNPNISVNVLRNSVNKQVINEINWNSMGNAPFFTYFNDRVNPGVKIASVIGEAGFEISLQDLGNACRKIGLEDKYRENILKALKGGIDQTNEKLKSNLFNGLVWEAQWNKYVKEIRKKTSFFS